MTQLLNLKRLWAEEEAQNLSEYALLLFLVSLTVVTALGSLASRLSTAYSSSSTRVEVASGHAPLSGATLGFGSQPQTNTQPPLRDNEDLNPSKGGVPRLRKP